jgi:hypothetical protein
MRTVGELLALPKTVPGDPPRPREVSHYGHRGWNIKVSAAGAAPGEFKAFLRVNSKLPEQFSIGLVYEEPGIVPVVLVRVNGDHGRHPNPDGTVIEEGPHIHAPNDAERLLPPPARAWSNGPAMATALGPDHNHLAIAWKRFAQEVTISENSDISGFMSGVHEKLSQLVAEDLFS